MPTKTPHIPETAASGALPPSGASASRAAAKPRTSPAASPRPTRCISASAVAPSFRRHVHDVLNVFMCTGFTRDTGQYFMKASPVRPGDFLEFFAEIDLLGCLSACPGGDCSAAHSSDAAACFPLEVEVYRPAAPPAGWRPAEASLYDRSHGTGAVSSPPAGPAPPCASPHPSPPAR